MRVAQSKGQKYGRNKRAACNAAYKSGMRWAVNKRKRMEASARRAAVIAARWAKRVKAGKPVRGTARAKRRALLFPRGA